MALLSNNSIILPILIGFNFSITYSAGAAPEISTSGTLGLLIRLVSFAGGGGAFASGNDIMFRSGLVIGFSAFGTKYASKKTDFSSGGVKSSTWIIVRIPMNKTPVIIAAGNATTKARPRNDFPKTGCDDGIID